MSAITDILLTHHLTLDADDETGGWHATCSCGADLGCCEDTREGQKIQAAHVAHLIDPDDREYTPGQRREAEKSMAEMSGLIDHVAIPAEDIRLADGTALIENGAINTALVPTERQAVSGLQAELSAQAEHGLLFIGERTFKVSLKRSTRTEVDVPLSSVHFHLAGHGLPSGESLGDGCVHPDDFVVSSTERAIPEPERGHDDSSTGDGPAATEHTDSVEVTARRGDDSDPGELGELRRAWRDFIHDYAAGTTHITPSGVQSDTHWCRLHRLMEALVGGGVER